MSSYIELLKPRLSATVIFSSLAGYFLAPSITSSLLSNYTKDDIILLFYLTLGGICLVGASNILNQIYEVNIDAKMERTKNRPLPTKRVSINNAFIFSLCMIQDMKFLVLAINSFLKYL